MNPGMLPLPAAAAARHDEALRTIAPHLSDRILEALIGALVKHADELAPGRLYTRDGGCAVGVMLRELYPGTCGPGCRPWYRLRRSFTIRQQIGDRLGPDTVRLEHIEDRFDVTCRAVAKEHPLMRRGEAATHVGLWMAARLADEREQRRVRAAARADAAAGATAEHGRATACA